MEFRILLLASLFLVPACSRRDAAAPSTSISAEGWLQRPETLDRAAASSYSVSHTTVLRQGAPIPPWTDNTDGARFIWYVLNRFGADISYVPTREIPSNPQFVEVREPDSADVAWWPGYAGLYTRVETRRDDGPVADAQAFDSLRNMEKARGAARFFRYVVRSSVTYVSGGITGTDLRISFPEKWSVTEDPNEKNATPYVFERSPIVDAEGTSVIPMISIVVQDIPDGWDTKRYSETVLGHLGLKPEIVFGATDGYTSLPDGAVNLCRYTADGKSHTIYVLLSTIGGKGVYMIADATDSIIARVEPEFRFVLRSLRVEPKAGV